MCKVPDLALYSKLLTGWREDDFLTRSFDAKNTECKNCRPLRRFVHVCEHAYMHTCPVYMCTQTRAHTEAESSVLATVYCVVGEGCREVLSPLSVCIAHFFLRSRCSQSGIWFCRRTVHCSTHSYLGGIVHY